MRIMIINGLGRIGRATLKIALERRLDVVRINNIVSTPRRSPTR